MPFNRKQSGQALTEYVLLLTFAVAIAFSLSAFFSGAFRKGVFGFNMVLERELRTGSFPEAQSGGGLWNN